MNLIIIPFGTPNWGVQSDNMKSVISGCRGKTNVVYLIPQWGIVSSRAYHPALLKGIYNTPEKKMLQTTAVAIRSWLHHQAEQYKRIVVLNYGHSMKFWNKGAAGTPFMQKVKVIRYLPRSPTVLRRRVTRACNE